MKKCNREGCDFETPDVNEFADHIAHHLDMENMRDTIDGFPDRHSFPVKCVLYLAFFVCSSISWEAISALLTTMGYQRITLERDIGRFHTGQRMMLATTTWASPDQPLNSSGGIGKDVITP